MCPYTVGVSLRGIICGGTVLDKTHILTAAHCVKHNEDTAWGIEVIINTRNWYYRENNVFQVSKAIIHKDYKQGTHNNIHNLADIAVLKLDRELPLEALRTRLQTVSLPNSVPQVNTTAEICGFGNTNQGLPEPPRWMYKLQTTTISLAECRQYVIDRLHTSHLCTRSSVGQGLSIGDSGSPLIHNGKVIGVASWGHEVNLATRQPQVFTDVYTYGSWIRDAMNWNDASRASEHWIYL
ncbi:chymotrypsin-2-like [Fopius arisanus]|uniref:Chymotrypsin-2-like n=1 Tax=Fopius arisanus TaxID=64838 RepID=A0A9R1SY27_9HYME|nr:PREDICTED: chymotrypsin-2-like [Fopius arisanus]